jgi:hypothetical protein
MAWGQTAVPSSALWLVTFAIIAIAVAQGFALYKAGSNIRFWTLGTIGGFFLFIILGCFVIFGLFPGLGLLALFVLVASFVERRWFHEVPQGHVELVSSFGKYSHMLHPGLNMLWPWEKVTQRVEVQEKQWSPPPLRIPLPPTQDMLVRASISYQLMPEGVRLAVKEGQNWEERLQQAFQQSLGAVASTFSRNSVMAWQRLSRTANTLDESERWWGWANDQILQQVMQWCVQVIAVHIQDVAIIPHQAPIVDAEPVPTINRQMTDTEIIAPQQRATAPTQTTQPRIVPSNAALSEAQKSAVEWLQSMQEDVAFSALEKAYKEVQEERVRVPAAIRDLAEKFDAVARDPQKSKRFKYDAARAALALYRRAQECQEEELQQASAPFYDETTTPMRRPRDENIRY